MQFTGLHDKNGKEIYEGDAVRYDDGTIYFIKWHDENACFYLACKNNGSDDMGFDQVNCNDFEIIGNIYENPELLTK